MRGASAHNIGPIATQKPAYNCSAIGTTARLLADGPADQDGPREAPPWRFVVHSDWSLRAAAVRSAYGYPRPAGGGQKEGQSGTCDPRLPTVRAECGELHRRRYVREHRWKLDRRSVNGHTKQERSMVYARWLPGADRRCSLLLSDPGGCAPRGPLCRDAHPAVALRAVT